MLNTSTKFDKRYEHQVTSKNKKERQIKKTQDELQWIVAQRLLSALTIPGFN